MKKQTSIVMSLLGLVIVCSLGCSHHHRHHDCKKGGCKVGDGKKMSKHHMDMTAEKHEEMSKKHLETATCLKSGKSKEECNKIMGK